MQHHLFVPIFNLVNSHIILAHVLLFLFVFWEGEISLILAGILVHLDMFSIYSVIPIVLTAALAKTIIGYYLGKYLGKKFPNSASLKFFERKVLYFLPRFKERPFWSIVLSKCIYGLNNITLVFAGYVGVEFKKYFKAEIISTVLWFGIMFALGLFFSATALSWSHGIRTFFLTILIFIIVFMFIQKLINLFVEIFEEIDSENTTKN
jgi:membrane protein DedA with SNARE-associated domain